jgi:hypothetical protein
MALREAKAPGGGDEAGRRRQQHQHVALEMGGAAERRAEEKGVTHEQLWMVPVGLVLLGTPLIAWLSLFASGGCRCLGRLRGGADQAPAVAPET